MIVNLFLADGDGHLVFKQYQNGDAWAWVIPEIYSPDILYVWSEYVGYFSKPQMFIVIPIGQVKEIHMTRRAGEGWG